MLARDFLTMFNQIRLELALKGMSTHHEAGCWFPILYNVSVAFKHQFIYRGFSCRVRRLIFHVHVGLPDGIR